MRHIPLLLLCAACYPDFATVDEACDGKVPGAKKLTNTAAIDTFARVSCYRRLAKLTRARVEKTVQEAAENHMAYGLEHVTVEDLDPWTGWEEEPGMSGFTGADVFDRLDETGYPNLDRGALSVWEFKYADGEDAEDRIDFWFPEPAVRQSYLQPAWVSGGYDQGIGTAEYALAYMNIIYQVPVRDHAATPVVYPKDGQEDVPTRFCAVWSATASYGMGYLGYPITITVGSSEYGDVGNPHGLNVDSSSLTGPTGTIDMMVETPETHTNQLRYSVAFYPLEPLQSNSEYTFAATIDWGTVEGYMVESIFKTGPEATVPGEYELCSAVSGAGGGYSAREVPPPPILTHRIVALDAALR